MVRDLENFKVVPLELKFGISATKLILRSTENTTHPDWKFTLHHNRQLRCRWKGLCLFKVDFAVDAKGMKTSNAYLNRNPKVYKGTDDKQDLVDIHYVILKFLLKRHIPYFYFKQRAIPLDPEKARAYILSKDEWIVDTEFVVTENHLRNQVISFRLITDYQPDPKNFTFVWFDHSYPRGGSWEHTVSRLPALEWTSRDEIFAWDEKLS